jgi:hypothetical protein
MDWQFRFVDCGIGPALRGFAELELGVPRGAIALWEPALQAN